MSSEAQVAACEYFGARREFKVIVLGPQEVQGRISGRPEKHWQSILVPKTPPCFI